MTNSVVLTIFIFVLTSFSLCDAQDPGPRILPPVVNSRPCHYSNVVLDDKGRLWVSETSGLYCWEDERWRHVTSQSNRLLRTVGDEAYFLTWKPTAIRKTNGEKQELVCLLPQELSEAGLAKIKTDHQGRVYVVGRKWISLYDPVSTDEVAERVEKLVSGLIDDRIDEQESTRNAILSLGHQAEPALRRLLKSSIPERAAAIKNVLKLLQDSEEVYAKGPWKKWDGVGLHNVWIAEAYNSVFVCTEGSLRRYQDGDFTGEVSYPHLEGTYGMPRILPLASDLAVVYSHGCAEWTFIDFDEQSIIRGVPNRTNKVPGVPDHLLRDEKRLADWFRECVQFNGSGRRWSLSLMHENWKPAEIEAGVSMRTQLDWEYIYNDKATFGSEILAINDDGSLSYLRHGRIEMIDIGHAMSPGAFRRALVDSQGRYWIMDKSQITSFLPR